MKEEETEAMNRLDEAVRKLEGEREEVRGRWEEMEGSLRRELEVRGEGIWGRAMGSTSEFGGRDDAVEGASGGGRGEAAGGS